MSSTTAVQYESTELMHKVELKISCQDLPSMDYMSKSDPMVVVFIKEGDSYVELGRTESVTYHHHHHHHHHHHPLSLHSLPLLNTLSPSSF
eukprot:TRINITY_DN377_c1_g1_i2.p1 TRINITY_DN377_c1_g1~~TRINITY_DN377_c1_g1_i2.p1  ORF type:complete len:103 (-),score=1.26 TRINITY_DN377_c1_g1_i2:436-708(-)